MQQNAAGPALIVERHPFLESFLRHELQRAGHDVVVSRSASAATLTSVCPATIVIGLSGSGRRPLEAIRRARRERADAHILAIVDRDDPAWKALALAMGANVVLGPADGRATLMKAIQIGSAPRQENLLLRRTS